MVNSPARFRVVAAGRRSYKTERAKRILVLGDRHHRGALRHPGGRFFYAAPTRAQAKAIAWNDLKALTHPYWAKEPSESSLTIYLFNGAEIHVVGMNRPQRIEGQQWHGGVMDEYADMKEAAWSAHVQPVTSDTNAWVLFIGVPEARNHFYTRFEYAQNAGDPEWDAFTWKSSDVLPPEVIAQAQASLPSRLFRQEYEATFELAGGRVYYEYEPNRSIVEQPFDPSVHTFMCWDFNASIKPMSVVLVQRIAREDLQRKHRGGIMKYVVTAEFRFSNTNTPQMCEAIADYLEGTGFTGTLEVCGDYYGKHSRSSSTLNDYEHIRRAFSHYKGYHEKTRRTPRIRNRVDALNRLFSDATGTRELFIARHCRLLIYDLENVVWAENNVELSDTGNPELTHLSDALSYFAHNHHPLTRPSEETTIR